MEIDLDPIPLGGGDDIPAEVALWGSFASLPEIWATDCTASAEVFSSSEGTHLRGTVRCDDPAEPKTGSGAETIEIIGEVAFEAVFDPDK